MLLPLILQLSLWTSRCLPWQREFSAGLLVRMKKIAFYTWRASREDGVLEYAHQVAHWQKKQIDR